jgi:hypothetical protein
MGARLACLRLEGSNNRVDIIAKSNKCQRAEQRNFEGSHIEEVSLRSGTGKGFDSIARCA